MDCTKGQWEAESPALAQGFPFRVPPFSSSTEVLGTVRAFVWDKGTLEPITQPFLIPAVRSHSGAKPSAGALHLWAGSPWVSPCPGQCQVAEPLSQSFSFLFQANRGKR